MASVAKRSVSLFELLPNKSMDLAQVYEGTHDPTDLEASYEHEQFLKQAFLDFMDKTQFTMESEEKHQFIALWIFWLCKYKPAEMGPDLQKVPELLNLAKCQTLEQFIQQAK